MLWEWREGKKMKSDGHKNKGEKFEGDNFKKVYERHIELIEEENQHISSSYVNPLFKSHVSSSLEFYFNILIVALGV